MLEELFKEFYTESAMAISCYRAVGTQGEDPSTFELFDANRAFEALTGIEVSQAKGKGFPELFPGTGEDLFQWGRAVREMHQNGTFMRNGLFYHLNSQKISVALVFPSPTCLCCVFHHPTESEDNELKKIEELEHFFDVTPDLLVNNQRNIHEFLENAFRLIKTFTRSREAFIFQYEEELDRCKLYAWSLPDGKIEKKKGKERQICIRKTELWEEAVKKKKPVMVNHYKAEEDPHRRKKARNHDVIIHNYIAIPVVNGNRVISIVGVANKDTDYVNEDLLNLSLITNSIWSAVERIQSEALLTKERELFRATVFALNEGVIVTDRQGRITLMNSMAEKLTAWNSEEAEGRLFSDIFLSLDAKTRERSPSPLKCAMKSPDNAAFGEDEILIPKTGEELNISWRASGMLDEKGVITGVVVSFRDLSKEYRQQKEMEGFLNMNLDMLCVMDLQGNFVRVNKKFEKTLGYAFRQLEGRNLLYLVCDEDEEDTIKWIESVVASEELRSLVNRCRTRDGREKYVEWNLEKNGEFLYASARDITEKNIREEELHNLAVFDELTGIYNRHFLDEQINEIMERSNLYQEPISMVLFDIDNFKKVNDTFGHPAGDKVLKELSDIVSGLIRRADIFIRFGGEEFMILMPGTSARGAMIVSEKIRFTLEHNRNPLVGAYTASFGVSERKNGESFEEWYKHSDEALYYAKHEGKNLVVNADNVKEMPFPLVHIEWKEEWESADEGLNEEHRQMVGYANEFIDCALSEESPRQINQKCEHLLELLGRHFNSEENILSEIRYPAVKKHVEEHQKLMKKALHLKHAFMKGEVEAETLFAFVVDDLILAHFMREDILYYPYLREARETNPSSTKK